MCDACVMNAVKDRMLSRRAFFTATAAAGAATALDPFTAPAAMAAGHGSAEDLTHTYDADFPTYFGTPGISTEQNFNFAEHGLNLVAPLCVIDITAKAADNPDAQLTPDDLKAWIAANGDIPDHACVALYSGWGAKTATDAFRGFDGEKQHFPGFHVDAAQMLLETGAGSLASDTLSLDHGISADFATHYAWLPASRFGIECIANLDRLPASGATIIVGAPKHRGGTGGPARIFAMV